jgi:hypothetical protein
MIGGVIAFVLFVLTAIRFTTEGATFLEWLFAIIAYSVLAAVINVVVVVACTAVVWVVNGIESIARRGQ